MSYRSTCLFIFFVFFVAELLHSCHGDVGTAEHYSAPYIPTQCYGNDPTQFPSSNFFAAAGDSVWDNGASCGRQYLVRCISASQPGTCIAGQTIQLKIVHYGGTRSTKGTTMVLSDAAFGAIANSSATSINIEFQQV